MRMHPPVAVVKCGGYEQEAVDRAVAESVRLVGGMERFVRPGQRVFVKVNLLSRKRPEEAVTTHPAVVEAVIKLVQAAGGSVVVGDSPGGPSADRWVAPIYRAAGIDDVARRTGAELPSGHAEAQLPCPEGRLVKSFTVTDVTAGADVIISVPKLKTHGLMSYTGAVKVLFGCIPGLRKAEYHLRMPILQDFADMLVDLALCVKPALTVMDAVVGMDGPGPSAGRARPVGLIMASPSPFALDVAAVAAVGHDPSRIPTIAAASRRGLPARLQDINLVGAPLGEIRLNDFVLPAPGGANVLESRAPAGLARAVRRWISARPVFDPAICTGCGECVENCPPKAIEMRPAGRGSRPVPDLDQCIRCFCCQELCRQKAVTIHRPWVARTVFK